MFSNSTSEIVIIRIGFIRIPNLFLHQGVHLVQRFSDAKVLTNSPKAGFRLHCYTLIKPFIFLAWF